jgi:spore maturation protein SpmA
VGASVLNWIWALLMLGSVATAAWTGTLPAIGDESIKSAKAVIDLVIGLIGPMILFLGVVRIASDAGLLATIVGWVLPLLRRLFPDVPRDHPAFGAMVMNLSANVLGLGNAATPLGLKAMVELNTLNRFPGVATDAMALFLAINATSVTLMIPSGVVAIRAQYSGTGGDEWASLIWAATLIATSCSTVTAVTAALLLRRMPRFAPKALPGAEVPVAPTDLPDARLPEPPAAAARPIERWIVTGVCLVLVAGLAREVVLGLADPAALGRQVMKGWPLPLLLFSLVAYGLAKGARAYELAVEGGREALSVAARIAPYMVMMLVAIGMFRASGALDALIGLLDPLTSRLGIPGSVLPLMLMKPLSGSGALAVLTDTLRTEGSYTYAGFLASAVNGSTETTFYVLTLYLGVIGVRNSRYILPACLLGDLAGYTGAVLATRLLCPVAA